MRDILLFVSGTTPQIVTETIWGIHRQRPSFNPVEIHVITTNQGRRVLDRRLMREGKLAALCTEIGQPRPRLQFHVIRDVAGVLLEDIRNTADNTGLANTVMAVVRDLTTESNTRLHASLSGGRKTMSFYLGYAMSLYGRPQDALYHVMVPPEFERCPDFFYIPNVPVMMTMVDGKEISTDSASIEVAEIPFLKLRDWIDEPILNASVVDFGSITSNLQAALTRPVLTFNNDECVVSIGEHVFELRPQLYALYRILAETCVQRTSGAGPDGVGPQHCGWLTSDDFASAKSRGTERFLKALDRLARARDDRYIYLKGVIDREGDGSKLGRARMAKIFNPAFSRLREALTKNVADPALRREFWIEGRGRSPARYGLLATAEQIVLEG